MKGRVSGVALIRSLKATENRKKTTVEHGRTRKHIGLGRSHAQTQL